MTDGLIVALDTSSDLSGVALEASGELLGEVTWRTRQNHSRELLPSLEWLLERHNLTRSDISGIVVCLGPGSYAGMRVGISTAKALAYSLDVPLAGIDRLAADAWPLVSAASGRVFAVHAAGRAELAWAAYELADGQPQREVIEPRLGPLSDLSKDLMAGDVVCGEPKALDDGLRDVITNKKARWVEAPGPRVIAVARLGAARLAAGDVDVADTLVPLYLRAPAIGPQPPR